MKTSTMSIPDSPSSKTAKTSVAVAKSESEARVPMTFTDIIIAVWCLWVHRVAD
jgi:hypothetical protein